MSKKIEFLTGDANIFPVEPNTRDPRQKDSHLSDDYKQLMSEVDENLKRNAGLDQLRKGGISDPTSILPESEETLH